MPAQLIPSPWELHPPLVHFPIAFLLAGVALDLFAYWSLRKHENPTEAPPWLRIVTQLATGLLIAGVLVGILAAITGLVAYFTVPIYLSDADILLNWHLGLAVSSLILFGWVAVVRGLDWARPPILAARVVGLFAAVLLAAGAALGGHLVYRGGAGFDPGLFTTPADRAIIGPPTVSEEGSSAAHPQTPPGAGVAQWSDGR